MSRTSLLLVGLLLGLTSAAIAADLVPSDMPGGGYSQGTDASRPASLANSADVDALVESWLPFIREVGGKREDLSAQLRAAAAVASAERVEFARRLQTLPAVMAALRGDFSGDAPVIERAAAQSLASGGQTNLAKAFGDVDRDLLYVPVPPCRIVDTRVAGGQIAAGTARSFDVTATSTYAGQGGDPSDCGGAGSAGNFAAAVLTISVPGSAASGTLTAYALNAPQPVVPTLEYALGVPVSTTSTVAMDQGPAANELTIFSTANSHVVVDIVGYFRNGNQPVFECTTSPETIDNVAAGATRNTVAPACPATYTMTGTNCESSTWQMPFVYFSDGTCSAQNNSSGTAQLRASRRCCRTRIP